MASKVFWDEMNDYGSFEMGQCGEEAFATTPIEVTFFVPSAGVSASIKD